MTENKKEILRTIRRKFDEDTVKIVKILLESENVMTLEEIEEKLQDKGEPLEQKIIRKALYALQDEGYARSRKIRDDETSWIHFKWNLFPQRILND